MKKKNRILVCILSAMILGSCLTTPALAATSINSEISHTFNPEEATVISEVKTDLPIDEPNVVQHDQIVTTYSDGTKIIDTLKVTEIPTQAKSADQIKSAEHTKKVERSGTVVATFYLTATFKYNVDAETVIRTAYSKRHTLSPNFTLSYYDLEVDTGAGGLWWKPWANVTGKYKFYMTSIPTAFTTGSLEIKCDSTGWIERK